jgi:hypothetical protein
MNNVGAEHVAAVRRFVLAQEIEEQGGQPRLVQHRGDVDVARAQAAAAAPMGEEDDAARLGGYFE